jgi:hypothetical protein
MLDCRWVPGERRLLAHRPCGSCRRPRAPVREERAAPLAPRSEPPAATLSGGLRPGSLRVHDPCKQEGHGSRLGFPGRRLPRGPAASANVARALQVLPQQARRVSAGGRGELGLDPAELGLRAAGVPPPERSAGGGGHPAAPRFALRGSTGFRPSNPWNCSAGEDPLPEPFRLGRRGRPGGRGLQVLLFIPSIGKSLRGHREMLSSLWLPWGMRR